jgi:TonB family protein
MNTLTYILQFNVFAILFYGFYLVFLQKETFHQPNRIFLVGSHLISLCVPVLTSDWLKSLFVSETVEGNIQVYYFNALAATVVSGKNEGISLYELLAIIYGIGVVLFFIKFLFSLQSLRKILQKGTQAFSAFTFGRKTYIDSNLPEYASIATHEQVHARQLHSADIIFMELLLVLNWFNPVLYFYEKAIKNIHEFLADEEAAKQLGPVAYAKLLLSQEFGVNPSIFINLFYEKATLKQRITMLAKPKSRKSAILKYGLALPIFLGMLIVSSAFVYKTDVLTKTDKLLKKQEVVVDFNFSKNSELETLEKGIYENVSVSKKDTTPGVIKTMDEIVVITYRKDSVVYFIDNVLSTKEICEALDPESIQSVSVIKTPQTINGKTYAGRIDTKLKKEFNRDVKTEGAIFSIKVENDELKDQEIFTETEEPAKYVGGVNAMYKFLGENIRYPTEANFKNKGGRVFVKFVIKKDGTLANFEITKAGGYGMDEEAIRVLKNMPKWKPAKQNGKIVNAYYNMPVVFKID